MSTLDRGKAHDVLIAQDWLKLPLPQRENALLDYLDACIDTAPSPAEQTLKTDIRAALDPSLRALYIVIAVWCLTGPIFRIVIQVTHQQPIDLLPFITFALGTYAVWRYLHTPHRRTEP